MGRLRRQRASPRHRFSGSTEIQHRLSLYWPSCSPFTALALETVRSSPPALCSVIIATQAILTAPVSTLSAPSLSLYRSPFTLSCLRLVCPLDLCRFLTVQCPTPLVTALRPIYSYKSGERNPTRSTRRIRQPRLPNLHPLYPRTRRHIRSIDVHRHRTFSHSR